MNSTRSERLNKLAKLNQLRFILTVAEFIMKLIEDPDPGAKLLVYYLIQYFEEEKKNCKPSCPLYVIKGRLADALRIPAKALAEVIAEMQNEPYCHHSYFRSHKWTGKNNSNQSILEIETSMQAILGEEDKNDE